MGWMTSWFDGFKGWWTPRTVVAEGSASWEPVMESSPEAGWFGHETTEEERDRAHNSEAVRLAKETGLKALPHNAVALIATLGDANVEIDKAIDPIKRDPGMAARVLKLANSPVFCGDGNLASLEQAAVRLGFLTLRSQVAAVVIKNSFEQGSDVSKEIGEHSLGVALVMGAIARHQGRRDEADYFLCGLLHEVGKLLLFQADEFDYETICAQQPHDVHGAEREALGFDHALLGAIAITQWGLPESIAGAVEDHHQPDAEGEMALQLRACDRFEITLAQHAALSEEEAQALAEHPDFVRAGWSGETLMALWADLLPQRTEALRRQLEFENFSRGYIWPW